MVGSLSGQMRSHHCGELKSDCEGQNVTLCGWVNKVRDLGSLFFIDLRDKYGVTQLGFESFEGDRELLKSISLESVIKVEGQVQLRPESARNSQMPTGDVEVAVRSLSLLGKSDAPPFLPYGQTQATETLRLKYRYLDLRTKRLQDILVARSLACSRIRDVLRDNKFIEVETPVLYKSTPEGARDYLVPSRVHPGKVYALPQSPQTLKQLLMIGGTDRYFQIVKCFRDEDLRADRQPEFTQVDIEVSFVNSDFLCDLSRELMNAVYGIGQDFALKRLSYQEAMDKYGSDKPDLRFDLVHHNMTALFHQSSFSTFSEMSQANGLIKGMFIPLETKAFSRKEVDALTDIVKPHGGKGVAWFKNDGQSLSGGISKFIDENMLKELESLSGENKGTWFFCADKDHEVAHACADAVRRHFGKTLELIQPGLCFAWIDQFPLLEWSEDRFVAKHHPFTSPHPEDLDLFMHADPQTAEGQRVLKEVRADAYDLVCNGYELGGGSVRIYNQIVQKQMFRALGMSDDEAEYQFGFFMEALKYGTPPHAGIAFGLDRLTMLLVGTDSITDVIAFPKTTSATDLMAQSPSIPNDAQMKELHLNWVKKEH